MRKYFLVIIVSLIILAGIGVYQYLYFHDERLHVVFCSVGQGDAILVRTGEGINILVDGGPDKSVLDCLAGHLPFWERRLDMVFLTHPHSDHYTGLLGVLDLYYVLSFDLERLGSKAMIYKQLIKKVEGKNIKERKIGEGDRFRIGKDVVMEVEAPSEVVLKSFGPKGEIGESGEQASLILHLEYKDFDLIITGDIQAEEMMRVSRQERRSIEVMQVPHHGSLTGMDEEIIELIKPKMAVISVGKKNTYGLPNEKILKMLEKTEVKVWRTDEAGDVEVVSDGERYWVK